jgi:hypothetical protein
MLSRLNDAQFLFHKQLIIFVILNYLLIGEIIAAKTKDELFFAGLVF